MKRVMLCAMLLSGAAVAADQPVSLLALFQRLPDLPATAQEAARWTNGPGKITEPHLVALKADLAAHQQWVEKLAAPLAQRAREQGQAQVQDISQGLAAAGIDMQRMQSDPAYAQQMQSRMRSMSPQQLMALSQQMVRPMNQDARLTNEAAAQASESAAIQEAAAAGAAYSSGQTARWQAGLASWRRADEAVAAINARKLQVSAPKPAIEFDNIGCSSACQGQWHAYAAQMLPLMIAREDRDPAGARRGVAQPARGRGAGSRQGRPAAERGRLRCHGEEQPGPSADQWLRRLGGRGPASADHAHRGEHGTGRACGAVWRAGGAGAAGGVRLTRPRGAVGCRPSAAHLLRDSPLLWYGRGR